MKKIAIAAAMFVTTIVSSSHAQNSVPPGYLIGNFTVTDEAAFATYLRAAGPISPRFGGKIIVYNRDAPAIEGEAKKGVVVIEFPSVAEARRFYHSPEYTAARKLREGATDGFNIITAGVIRATD